MSSRTGQITESQVRTRVAELGLDEIITPFVLEELRSIQESKAVSTVKGRPDSGKRRDIRTAQSGTRFVSSLRSHARHARKSLDNVISEFEKRIIALVKSYKSGDITFTRLTRAADIVLKESSEKAFQLGTKSAGIVKPNGSAYDLTTQEKSWLASYLKEELKFFNSMLKDVSTGQSDRKTAARIKSYATAIKSVFESGRVLSVGPDVIIEWVLESDNPCPDCKILHRYSPYTVDTLPATPKAGKTRCLANCYCSLKITKTTKSEVAKVKKKSKKATWVLSKIRQAQRK